MQHFVSVRWESGSNTKWFKWTGKPFSAFFFLICFLFLFYLPIPPLSLYYYLLPLLSSHSLRLPHLISVLFTHFPKISSPILSLSPKNLHRRSVRAIRGEQEQRTSWLTAFICDFHNPWYHRLPEMTPLLLCKVKVETVVSTDFTVSYITNQGHLDMCYTDKKIPWDLRADY